MNFDKKGLEKILQTKIKDVELYKTALTHRSFLNEHPEYSNPSNERLEFLGDAVLQVVTSQYLYENYANAPEGDLTNYRAALVNTTSIGNEAKRLGYGELLLLSNGEESTGGRNREYILANTFEAVLGAIYLENNLEHCRKFLIRELLYKLADIVDNEGYKDHKSKFQELVQEKIGVTPVYKVVRTWGSDHEKTFRIAVYVADREFGKGDGGSKQKAEQNAAQKAIDKLKSL